MDEIDRRRFLYGTGGAVVATGLAACRDASAPATPPTAAAPTAVRGPADPGVVRVASVPTAVEGNLLPVLIREFEQQTEEQQRWWARRVAAGWCQTETSATMMHVYIRSRSEDRTAGLMTGARQVCQVDERRSQPFAPVESPSQILD
jgi:hypothetical protein